MTESYVYWDLIAQEAYSPSMPFLRKHDLQCFLQKSVGKSVWLFGCNEACAETIRYFCSKWNIVGVLDNSPVLEGKEFEGMTVYSPLEAVSRIQMEDSVVILCLRLNSDVVAKQLLSLGVSQIFSLGVLLRGMEPYASFVREIECLKAKPLQDMILMESTNDFDGNTGALYQYLHKVGTKHKFVWIVKNESAQNSLLNPQDEVIYPDDIPSLQKYVRYRAIAKWEIWESHPIRKVRPDQVNVFLQHYGMGYKQVAHLYSSPEYVDFALTTNEFVYEMEKNSITYGDHTKFIFGELPRNDVLAQGPYHELEIITKKYFRRVVMWAPTFRESAMFRRIDSDISYPFGISLIYTEEDMERLNNLLCKIDMLMIIKIHPRQKLNFSEKEYSNILYLDGTSEKKLHPYKLLTQMDAMISDYSSIVFDYMLLDRPIAWVLEDRDHYKIEYLMDNPMDYMPGEKIYSMDDLESFLLDVSNGKDPYRKAREELCRKCNAELQGRGAEKLTEVLGL